MDSNNYQANNIMISFIIVNYNTKELTHNCITSINNYFDNLLYEIIVVDNNSTDDSIIYIKEKHPDIIIIENRCNVGFGKANNIGVKESKGDYIILVNSDIEFIASGIERLIFELDNDRCIGAISPKLLYEDLSEQTPGQAFPTLSTLIFQLLGLGKLFRSNSFVKDLIIKNYKTFGNFSPIKHYINNFKTINSNRIVFYDWITAACFLIRKDVFNEVNGFDENIFLYEEDVDLCWRLYKKNYKFAVHNDMEVIHKVGSSSKSNKELEKIKIESKLYVLKKIFPKFKFLIAKMIISIHKCINN